VSTPVDDLIFDVSGMLYRTFHALQKQPGISTPRRGLLEDDENEMMDPASLALHSALMSMNKSFKQFKPKRVVACFDRPNNWRALYMKSDLSVTGVPYKGNRRQDMTPAQQAQYFKLLDHMKEFETLLGEQTGIITVAGKSLEADDCIAGWVQANPSRQKVVMTLDSDLSQLIDSTTSVCNFKTGEIVVCEDPKYLLFEKTFRGDSSDNIASAVPRIRKTKIQQAYTDPYTLSNILNGEHVTKRGDTILVSDVIDENQLLMDLTKQPPEIRVLIDKAIDSALNKTKRFDYWGFAKFCKERKLTKISESLQTFRPLLVGGYGSGVN
jgi:hypothetical protein